MEKLSNNSTSSAEGDLDTSHNEVDEMEIYNETNLDQIESFFKNDFEADFLEDDNF